jgi:hypothetical protein
LPEILELQKSILTGLVIPVQLFFGLFKFSQKTLELFSVYERAVILEEKGVMIEVPFGPLHLFHDFDWISPPDSLMDLPGDAKRAMIGTAA